MNTALSFHLVSKTLRIGRERIQILRDVSFELKEGETLALLGPNGAGKSTCIRIILDMIRDYRGSVTLHGHDARRAQARSHVAYVAENPSLHERLTPMEVLRTGLARHDIRRSDANAWCKCWLQRLEVEEYAHCLIGRLPKGATQKVALAHAMAVQPRLLILDEPFSGLDPYAHGNVLHILDEYRRAGGSLFLTSHRLQNMERLADRVGFMRKGKLLAVRPYRELATERKADLIIRYEARHALFDESSSPCPGVFEYRLAYLELQASIARLLAQGGTLLAIRPELSLEDLFFRFAARDGA
ncbi:ABC transporter ATP-binding protein [Stutzerimonas kirkiae]|uniref:ABC transporter ATP-binding protein n=1 Tax=Stutzerimonas kirkiae TaxID=2211392 RepID=A0A4Q9QYR0_9GAMM|nr:ABC transporter ATP-binding protein [Stutzerimonas kirkiae]TBU90663.1 ABC transporter ATP-binding protein [Stutzerimonas kirkiae]TBV00175.1 ABC transporter ATP-binding protein [Stutzerimonas kirkiae]